MVTRSDSYYDLELSPLNSEGCRISIDGAEYILHEPQSLCCDIHNEEYMRQLEEFDKNYPYMEKKVLPGQWR